MRTNWKLVERDACHGRWARMYVTLSPKGVISLNHFAWEKMGRPTAYHVLFDAEDQRIGLKPTATGVKHAFPIQQRSESLGKKINVFRMMNEQRIKLPHGIRFTDMEIDTEGVLILNLRTAETSNASVGWNRRREAKTNTVLGE